MGFWHSECKYVPFCALSKLSKPPTAPHPGTEGLSWRASVPTVPLTISYKFMFKETKYIELQEKVQSPEAVSLKGN